MPIATNASVGAPAFVVSHPSKNFYAFTSGMVSRYFVSGEDKIKATMMSITADFGRGSSGCPVFNEFGAVVGMAESVAAQSVTVLTCMGESRIAGGWWVRCERSS